MTQFALMFGAVLCGSTFVTNAMPTVSEIRSVRFHSPRLSVSRERADSASAFVRGQLRVDMSFVAGTARKPLLRIVCLCEVDGSLVCYDGFWDKPHTYRRIQRSDIAAAFKSVGFEPNYRERELAYRNPALITKCLPEVAKSVYSAATYGDTELNKGFFRLSGVTSQAKVLLFRLEMWQNGNLVGSFDSSKTGLGMYSLPEDWYMWKRYPERFKYDESN